MAERHGGDPGAGLRHPSYLRAPGVSPPGGAAILNRTGPVAEALGMAGHSHSANIAVRKGKQDAARGKLFSKLARYIIIAARNGGGDPDTNLRLRYAIDKARAVSMPRDNIERAVKKGIGGIGDAIFEEITHEGY